MSVIDMFTGAPYTQETGQEIIRDLASGMSYCLPFYGAKEEINLSEDGETLSDIVEQYMDISIQLNRLNKRMNDLNARAIDFLEKYK